MKQPSRIIWLTLFAIAAVVARVVPHAPNLALMGTLAAASGYYLRGHLRVVLPLTAAVVSDLFLGHYSWPIMLSVYIGYLVYALAGTLLSRWRSLMSPIVAVAAGSVSFFLITNFAVWAWSGMYPPTGTGLISSYVNALPFFRNSFVSDIYATSAVVAIVLFLNSLAIIISRRRVAPGQTNTEHV